MSEDDEVEELTNRLRFSLQWGIELGGIDVTIIALETLGLGFQINLNWKTLTFNILVINLFIQW